jgi:hypothetical protein
MGHPLSNTNLYLLRGDISSMGNARVFSKREDRNLVKALEKPLQGAEVIRSCHSPHGRACKSETKKGNRNF